MLTTERHKAALFLNRNTAVSICDRLPAEFSPKIQLVRHGADAGFMVIVPPARGNPAQYVKEA